MSETETAMGLRTIAIRGGFYLALRQALAILISTIGFVLLARTLGPEAYGVWVAAIGVYTYLSSLSGWGVNVYLIRRQGEPPSEDYHQAFSLLLLLGLVGTGLAFLALPLLQRWLHLEEFGPVALVLFAGLPVNLVASVPFARLERALDYRKVALIELSGLTVFYPVALPLAYQGLGPWAPVAGWWASQLLTLGLLYQMSGYRPRFHWETARARAMVGYGIGFSASEWISNLGYLVNPLIVGRYVGAEAVGQVGLAMRLVEQFGSVVNFASVRLSIPVFARLQQKRAQLMRALTEGMSLQIITLGPILAGLGLLTPWVLPILLGPGWLPAAEVYPFIAVGYLAGTAFSLHLSVLWVVQKVFAVALFRLIYVCFFAGAALVLVPRIGLFGFGWACLLALPAWLLFLVWFRLYVGRPVTPQAGIWFMAWAVALFSWPLGYWVWLGVLVPLAWPESRKELLRAATMLVEMVRKNGAKP